MMSLLNVTVKRGNISAGSDQQQHQKQGSSSEQHNTFLVLKLENVKSQTLPLKGVDPAWDEEFLFETSKSTGVDLLVELWEKGLIWDNVIGYKLIQVDQLFQGQLAAAAPPHDQYNGYPAAPQSKFHSTRWFTLDADLLVSGLDQPTIIGTKNPTPYRVLLDLRWELTSFVVDHGGGGLGGGLGVGGMHQQSYVEHSSVDNYNNKIDTYGGSSMMGYDNGSGGGGGGAYEDVQDYSRQQQMHPYNNSSEMYSSTVYNNGLADEDALYNRPLDDDGGGGVGGGLYDDDNRSYLMGNSYGGRDGSRSRESTFQDNNYSYYDNTYPQQQPSSCDITKRPKLLPQVPMAAATTVNTRDLSSHQQQQQQFHSSSHPGGYINDCGAELPPSGFSSSSFDVYGTHSAMPPSTMGMDPYGTSDCSAGLQNNLPYDIDNEHEYECERPSRTRRKVLPSAPMLQPPVAMPSQYDEFDTEPLSYNSQPPSKLDDRSYGGEMYEYELDSLMGVINHVDQLNWKNLSRGNSYDLDDYTPPPPRMSSKRKVLPQVPVQMSSKYGAKSLPATPATSAMVLNGKSRKLPYPAGGGGGGSISGMGIPTSTTTTGFGLNDYSYTSDRPPYTSSLSADGGDEHLSSMYHHQPYEDMTMFQDPAKNNIPQQQQQSRSAGKPSLLADMKSLFSKTSSSILPAMSSTLNNVSSSLSSSIPTVPHLQQPKCPPVSSTNNETDISYDFMKSNKFEEANQSSMVQHPDMNSSYYDDPENQLNNNYNSMGDPNDQSMYGYDSYDQNMGYEESITPTIVPKLLPSVPAISLHQQQVPFNTSSSSTMARNFFQSKNNTTFHSTVENISEEDPPSSSAALNPSNMNKMSTNNSYELEDMSVDKSLYGSSFHTDIDEYDLIANGDIKQNFTYTEKNLNLAAAGAGSGGSDIMNGSAGGHLKTDAKSKLNHSFMTDNDAVNNNSANRGGGSVGGYGVHNKSSSSANNEYADEYSSSFNESAGGGVYRQPEVDEYSSYDHQHTDMYYNGHAGGSVEDDQYYDGYSGSRIKVPTSVAVGGVGQQDGNAAEYYYNQVVELGTVVGSNLEGIEELDEYERDEKDVEDEEQSPYDYNYYNNASGGGYSASSKKKDSLKSGRDHETYITEEGEDEEGERQTGHLDRDNSEDYIDEEEEEKDDSKQWTDDYRHHASDDEIIEPETKKPPVVTTTISGIATLTATASHSEVVGPSPLSGISALMSSMGPVSSTQSSLSPGSMLAAGITTTLAANISNTITTTITGSPSIIFDSGENELGAGGTGSTISKTMGALGEGATKVTAKQRWHHAYNKIIMQLNVSNHSFIYSFLW